MESIRDVLCREVDRRATLTPEQNAARRKDLLDAMVASLDPLTGKPWTRTQFRGQVATLAFGALDTTVSTEWYQFWLAARNPGILDPIRDELAAFLAERERSGAPAPPFANGAGVSYDDMTTRLPVLMASSTELMRMTVSGPNAARHVVEDVVLVDESTGVKYRVPSGRSMWISLALTSLRNPRITNPAEFDAKRFTERKEDTPNGLPFFGFGSRLCAGQKFGRIQLLTFFVVLAARRPKMQLRADCVDVKTDYKPTLVPVPAGCWIRFTKGA